MKNIKKIVPNITDENEKEYWVEYKKTSSPQIREALIKKYAPLVKNEANKIKANTKIVNIIDFVDFESFGFLGLSDAVDGYDPNQEVTFKTYASVKIQEAIYDELRKIDVLLPKHIRKEIREIAIIREILEIKLKEKAKPKEK